MKLLLGLLLIPSIAFSQYNPTTDYSTAAMRSILARQAAPNPEQGFAESQAIMRDYYNNEAAQERQNQLIVSPPTLNLNVVPSNPYLVNPYLNNPYLK